MLLKKLLLIGGGVVVGSTALASAIAIPISQSQLNSSSTEVPTDPNGNNQPNDQGGNNNQNGDNNNNPQVPDNDNNGNSGENVNPEVDNNLIKDVKLPEVEVFFRDFKSTSLDINFETIGDKVFNKSINSNEELNNHLESWFNQNKNNENFNDTYFVQSNLLGFHVPEYGYNYKIASFISGSAKINTEILNDENKNPQTFNKVYSFEIDLTPNFGHSWIDGTSGSKKITVYGIYSVS
ncbi:hypothetical protein [Malacoplasma penetrans HF-2]|uniref:Uncharacterized protein n=1 Tax=Malacoplasma penetrans (strain HF-2) TaxID=272633 RepID=Q8EVM4_MALP2|nr:hypothetical protein [Malacoplasma penetrans]BAC44328.1 hypothetical protein [Malacoplasma penetrans HF-2]